MKEANDDLRKILSQNIKFAREALHITQSRLAEYADISLPYMTDIEHCKTWVSDKTLKNIARALNMEAYQLLIPLGNIEKESGMEHDRETQILGQIAELISNEKSVLKKSVDEAMDGLMGQIIRLYADRHDQPEPKMTAEP
ncbi:MAG: helix-turn-helix domain-containing protein [Treponema sp.]|nr:helix-turn-helix domain-containing protein [Treponema sp.]